jgi:hypothetical protein
VPHIIALPYWCEEEIKNFLQVLERWPEFCQTDAEYKFLIVGRFDAPNPQPLVDVCSKHASTSVLRCDRYQWTGHPGGANGMFRQTMETVLSEAGDHKFLFWFEHDLIPINANWLTHLAKAWGATKEADNVVMMGHHVTQSWIDSYEVRERYIPYISGSACYHKAISEHPVFSQITEERCFDVLLSLALKNFKGSVRQLWHMFDLWFFMPPWASQCDLNCLMLNGAKDYEQRAKLIDFILARR